MKKFLVSLMLIPFIFSISSYSEEKVDTRVDISTINIDSNRNNIVSRPDGIDISRYQNKIKWSSLDEIDFIFIKATEGNKLVDPKFKSNWDSAKSRGIIKGAYHFYRYKSSPELQFKSFKKLVKLDCGDFPPVLDVEVIPRKQKALKKMKRDVKKWLVLAENHYGKKPIIYAPLYLWKSFLNSPEFDGYVVWVASYGKKDVSIDNWHFWQYSCTHKCPAIRGNVDHNFFNGTLDELKTFCLN